MNNPQSYEQWFDLFDALKQRGNEEELLKAAQGGTFQWEPVTAELWAQDFLEVLTARIDLAKQRFDRDLSHAAGNEGRVTLALNMLKKDLQYAIKLTEIRCIPPDDRKMYAEVIQNAADRFAASLDASAKSDRSGKMAILVKNAKINNL